MTALLELLLVLDELDEPLLEPVPVGAVVTVPVPAWLSRLEHELDVELVCVLALPLKSHAVEALLWDL
jgi:hypothetical protein